MQRALPVTREDVSVAKVKGNDAPLVIQKPPPSPLPNACTAYLDPDAAIDDENRGEATKVIRRFTGNKVPDSLEYVIALVPNPRHTRLSMLFDRSIDAIEDAAQDEKFTYDSSWLPWRVETKTYGSREDELKARKSQEAREECPGVMLFRKRIEQTTDGAPYRDPYQRGLFVFVVGEQPTEGLNSREWENAVDWLHRNRFDRKALRVIGPSFSGTLPSLLEKLKTEGIEASLEPAIWGMGSYIFSGTVGSCQSVEWFQKNLPGAGLHTRFGVFQENDELQLYRLFRYLRSQGEDLRDVAILSEDETAYGGSLDPGGGAADDHDCHLWSDLSLYPDSSHRPVALFYPRDISALRSAYQAQSIFSQGQSAADKQSPRTVLSEDLGADGSEQGDTPASYSTQQMALTEEAELYGLVSFLRAHHSRYVAVRGSNPLDYLFLTRFLHHAYPEGRVIVVGSEILFTRELDTTEFRGSMALTNFPLLPRSQHWNQLFFGDTPPIHGHRVFASSYSEGLYIASRFLMKAAESGELQETKGANDHLSLPALGETEPDFADPFWLRKANPETTTGSNSNTWLTVLGRDGYWPVAVLKEGGPPDITCPATGNGQDTKALSAAPAAIPPSLEAERSQCGGRYDGNMPTGMRPPMPWFLAILLSLVSVGWHVAGCSNLTGNAPYFSNAFRPPDNNCYDNRSKFLIGASTAFVFGSAVLLTAPSWPLFAGPLWSDTLLSYFLWIPALGLIGAIVCDKVRIPFVVGAIASTAALFILFNVDGDPKSVNSESYYYRAIHLTDGVSPLLPLLFLLGGLYIWAWQNLAGNRLLGEGRPRLPDRGFLDWKYFRASDAMAERIDNVARPCGWQRKVVIPPIFVVLLCVFCFFGSLPVLSFEGLIYRAIINFSLLAVLLLIAAGLARIFWTWTELRRLLVQLARMPLCRTFAALKDISVRSLWEMSGSVPRTQYKFFAQQLNAARRLRYELAATERELITEMNAVVTPEVFSKRYLKELDHPAQWNNSIRLCLAHCAGTIMKLKLEAAWDEETKTHDCLREKAGKPQAALEEKGTPDGTLPLSEDKAVRAAEEFICLLYISYIQNMLARMRTMVLSVSALYVATMLALAFYPFAPRPSIAIWMLLVLIAFAGVVAFVYAGLERDQVLSYITSTEANLGWEFWAKYATFLLPPLLALVTAQFPEIADSLLRWVQPGLDAVK
jgi:hypothetical protein